MLGALAGVAGLVALWRWPGRNVMPRKQSAGLLLFRGLSGALEVLLVHPGGPLWAGKTTARGRSPRARSRKRGHPGCGASRSRRGNRSVPVRYVHLALASASDRRKDRPVWAVESDFDPASLKSNLFEMEWPPKSGSRRSFPEVDRAAWFDLETAGRKILASQAVVLKHLEDRLTETVEPPLRRSRKLTTARYPRTRKQPARSVARSQTAAPTESGPAPQARAPSGTFARPARRH